MDGNRGNETGTRRSQNNEVYGALKGLTRGGGGGEGPLEQPARPVHADFGVGTPEEAGRDKEAVGADETVVAVPDVGVVPQRDAVACDVPHDFFAVQVAR